MLTMVPSPLLLLAKLFAGPSVANSGDPDYPDISSQERTAAIERWDTGAVWAATRARRSTVEVKTAIEAPLMAVRVERATSAGDRALDVAETRVRPFEALILRSPAAGHDRLVLEPGISEATETAEA